MRKRIAILIFAFILSLYLVSCQSNYNDYQYKNLNFSANNQINQNYDNVLDKGPVKGGTLRLFSTKPDTFNPLLTKNTYVCEFLNFIYEGLVAIDEKQKPKPLLSDSWTVSSDGLVWNFHIREDVTWSDGKEFTASDAEFTFNYILNTVDSVYKIQLINIASVTAADKSNLKIILKKPDSFTAEKLTFPIIPSHLKNMYESSDFKPVGTGPFIFDNYVKDKSIALKKNDKWWFLATDEYKTGNIMLMDQITIKLYKSADDRINAIQAYDIDVVCIEMDDISKYISRTDILMKVFPSREFEFLTFNLNDPVFADISVRKAINAAINRQTILKELLEGHSTISDIPIHPDSWLLGEKEDTVKENIVDEGALMSPGVILQQGGWKQKETGYYKLLNGTSKKLEIELLVNSNNSRRVLISERICQQLTEAGIPAKVIRLPWRSLYDRIDSGKYHIAYSGCRITQAPDLSFLYSSSYLSSFLHLQSDSGRNISGYVNPDVNSIIDKLYKETDNDIRKNLVTSFRNTVYADLPYIGLFFTDNAVIYRKNVRGILKPNVWNKYNDITAWYLTELQ